MLSVLKFGGSSMADAKQLEKVKDIISRDEARTVVIVSAPGKRFKDDHKITDLLYLCHAHLTYGVACDSVYDMIKERYLSIRNDLNLDLDLESDFDALYEEMQKGISQDKLVSRGEYFSAKVLASYLGYEFIDSADWVKFDFSGEIDTEHSYEALAKLAKDKKCVIPGFYGVMPDGHIKTMTRGGSDITGALAAAALSADVYENWTDVSGILMADPRIVPEAKPISRVTYNELRELSYLGAQVLHEATIFPVREKNIPLNIRNTNDPDHPGTLIREVFPDDEKNEEEQKNFITGIAGKKDYTIITITKKGMSNEIGAFRKILETFENHKINVSYAPSGIDCFSVVVENKNFGEARYEVLASLKESVNPDHIHVSENIAIIAVVGRKMVFRSGTSGKIFAALGENGINIRMISQGPEELNIIIGIKEHDFNTAVQVLYRNFVK